MVDDELQKGIESNKLRLSMEEFSEEQIATLLSQFKRLEEDFREINGAFDDQTAQWRKEKGKERLALMLGSQEETMRCLEDADPSIRELALHLALDHWKADGFIFEQCERMAVSDPSVAVRAYAVEKLGGCYRRQKNARVGSICAKKVSDPNASFEERQCAYFSLVLVMGNEQHFNIPRLVMDFPESIDWGFVNRHVT